MIAMVLMSFMAIRALRVWWYEVSDMLSKGSCVLRLIERLLRQGFVLFHILMAVFAVAGLFMHISLLQTVRVSKS